MATLNLPIDPDTLSDDPRLVLANIFDRLVLRKSMAGLNQNALGPLANNPRRRL